MQRHLPTGQFTGEHLALSSRLAAVSVWFCSGKTALITFRQEKAVEKGRISGSSVHPFRRPGFRAYGPGVLYE